MHAYGRLPGEFPALALTEVSLFGPQANGRPSPTRFIALTEVTLPGPPANGRPSPTGSPAECTWGLSAKADNRHEVPGEDDFNRREGQWSAFADHRCSQRPLVLGQKTDNRSAPAPPPGGAGARCPMPQVVSGSAAQGAGRAGTPDQSRPTPLCPNGGGFWLG